MKKDEIDPARRGVVAALAGAVVASTVQAAPQRADTSASVDATSVRFGSTWIKNSRLLLLSSSETGGHYELFVWTPPSYTSSSRSYPLLLTLDANFCFATTVETAAVQAVTGAAKEVIVAGIGSAGGVDAHMLRRLRDYTPGGMKVNDEAAAPLLKGLRPLFEANGLTAESGLGGAAPFLSFLTTHVVPYIMQNYRIDTSDVGMAGHSAAGAFASFVLLSGAKPFTKLIIGSFPTLFYGDNLVALQKSFAAAPPPTPVSVFYGYGGMEVTESSPSLSVLSGLALLQRLHVSSPGSMNLTTRVFEDENHASVMAHIIASGVRLMWPH